MPIIFACQCGKPLKANEESVGKRTRCPHCGAIMVIPQPEKKAGSTVETERNENELAVDLDWSSLVSNPSPDLQASSDLLGSGSHLELPVMEAAGGATLSWDGESPRYKVLAQEQGGFSGKFRPDRLEQMLNEYAQHGWTLKAALAIKVHSHAGDHDEVVVILEH